MTAAVKNFIFLGAVYIYKLSSVTNEKALGRWKGSLLKSNRIMWLVPGYPDMQI